jgi:hypothetical protein
MATQIQYRRGTGAQNDAFTGANGEITVNTSDWTLRVFDGANPGGYPVVGLTQTQTLTNKTLTSPVLNNPTISGTISSSGNITAANFITSGLVTATGNITSTANVAGGNVIATTLVSAGGNVTGGNITTAGLITATGNIVSSANVTGGNITTAGLVTATGNITSTANVAGGNIVATTLISAGGNVTGGNITTAGLITATGNITSTANVAGGNLVTAGLITATGNITSTANVTGGNLVTAGLITATGNVTGGNITTAGLVTATGNITSTANVAGGNLVTAGQLFVNSGSNVTAIINSAANGVGNIGSSSTYFNTVFAKATTAQYADLAELYVSDADYEPGTVVSFGGDHEITITTVSSDAKIAGVISTNPSYLMNSGQQGFFVLPLALTGKVPTRVTGNIAKGDMIVSAGNGMAMSCATPTIGTVIGKSLEDFSGSVGVINVVVGRL